MDLAAQMEDLLGRILRGKDAEVKAHPSIQANVIFRFGAVPSEALRGAAHGLGDRNPGYQGLSRKPLLR